MALSSSPTLRSAPSRAPSQSSNGVFSNISWGRLAVFSLIGGAAGYPFGVSGAGALIGGGVSLYKDYSNSNK